MNTEAALPREGMKMGFIVIPQKVVPATFDQLMRFSLKDLRGYAKTLGVESAGSKQTIASALASSGKATLCASLGN